MINQCNYSTASRNMFFLMLHSGRRIKRIGFSDFLRKAYYLGMLQVWVSIDNQISIDSYVGVVVKRSNN